MKTRSASGFTLIEVVVALVLVGLAAGALIPTVINQVSKGETNRVVDDLSAIETGVKAFRVDVQRWPSGLGSLVTQIDGSDEDLSGGTFPPGLRNRWRGPYLERGSIPGDTIATAMGGVVLADFSSEEWGGTDFVTVKVKGITEADARRISLVVDGDTATTEGRIRWVTGGGSDPDTLVFHATPES